MTDMQDREAAFELARKQVEPLDEDTVEVLMLELDKLFFRMNRICNTLLNHPKGIHEGALDSIENIKCELSRVKWYRELKNKERLGLGEILSNARLLANFAIGAAEQDSLSAMAAIRLLELLGDGPA